MKKIICLSMILVICISLCACSSNHKATIQTNDGESVSMTAKELCKIESTNDLLFQEKYAGSAITFKGVVEKVATDRSFTVDDTVVGLGQTHILFKGGWELILDDNTILPEGFNAAHLEKGDVLCVTSTVLSCENTLLHKNVYLIGNGRIIDTVFGKGTLPTTIQYP